MGHSAGGHMATLLVVNDHFLSQHSIETSKIKGVIIVSGVFEIISKEGGATPKYLGMVFGDDSRVWKEASCQSHLEESKKLPPFLIAWSSEENPLIVEESTNFVSTLQGKDYKLKTYVFPGKDHDSFQNELMNTSSEFYQLFQEMMK